VTTVGNAIIERLAAPGTRLPLMLLACLLLLLALANPALRLSRNTYDFVFVVDITGSMNVADAGPSAGQRRLAFARHLVHEALEELPCGSRAGLAVFTEHRSFLLLAPVEICENHLVLSTMTDEIDPSMAWAELSEVAKGLYSGIDAVGALAAMRGEGNERGKPHLVFMTDGHEAPPVHPSLRPRFNGDAGTTGGLIVGIGGPEPVPIPYLDEDGRVAGYWAQDEVMQVDRHSAGRPSTQGETMIGIDSSDLRERIARGTEHLSSLREGYLQQLAAETGLDYLRATTVDAFARAFPDRKYARQQSVVTSVAWIPAALCLLCLVWIFSSPLLRSRSLTGQPSARWSSGRVRDAVLRRSARHR
jgi:mxaL protein